MWSLAGPEPGRASLRSVTVIAVVLALAASCSGGASSVEVGEGELPPSVPPDIPMPAGAEIGATRVDRPANQTEVVLEVGWTNEELIRFYTIELVSGGFIVARSTDGPQGWEIAFNRGDLLGTIVVAGLAEGARATLTINRS